MRFGVFLPPLHPPDQDPTLALQRDLELVEWLDTLGFDEAWIGEHHSGGYELIGAPEVFIAAAAERTRRIKLGTGVSSLPYHHPLLLTERIVLLDHLTRGRVMLGAGPGALPSDAYMLGVDPEQQRPMMEEALETILALLEGDEPVTRSTEWFTLRDGYLQLRPYTSPRFEIAVAATISPAGPRAAGRFGLGLLSLGATTTGGFDVLREHWDALEERAAEFGTEVDRDAWRLVGPMHLAETERQARKDVAFGLRDWAHYFQQVAALPLAPSGDDPDELVDAMSSSGLAVIGTPDLAAAQIDRLVARSGGFGCYLLMGHDWADREATLRSYELFARYVAPRFHGRTESLLRSRDWVQSRRGEFIRGAMAGIAKAAAEREAASRAGAR
jgi:limonene 1,2-monooxygenase